MKTSHLALVSALLLNSAAAVVVVPMIMPAAHAAEDGPYHVLQVAKVGGDGGYDYVKADSADRRLFVTRHGKSPHPRPRHERGNGVNRTQRLERVRPSQFRPANYKSTFLGNGHSSRPNKAAGFRQKRSFASFRGAQIGEHAICV